MSNKKDVRDHDDPLDPSAQVPSEIPAGLDRRKFIMRSAVISAAAVMNGCSRAETEAKAPPPAAEAPPAAAAAAPAVTLAADLNVVKKGSSWGYEPSNLIEGEADLKTSPKQVVTYKINPAAKWSE